MYPSKHSQSQGLEPKFQDYEINCKVPLLDRPWATALGTARCLTCSKGTHNTSREGSMAVTPAHTLLLHVPTGLELHPSCAALVPAPQDRVLCPAQEPPLAQKTLNRPN